MNLANGLTLTRIILAPLFLLLISVPNIYTHYGALLVFTVSLPH